MQILSATHHAKAARDTTADVICSATILWQNQGSESGTNGLDSRHEGWMFTADSCPPEQLRNETKNPHLVVSYINCSAGTKALSDITALA